MTSLAQWRLLYILETPTTVAPPYIAGPIAHRRFGHQRDVSFTTAAAAANAATEWPDGNDRYESPLLKPRPNCQLFGSNPVLSVGGCTNGRARPNESFNRPAKTLPTTTASVP